jgi:hypothetical protein
MVTYGHTHSPEYRLVEGVRYINTGTWKHAIHAFLDKGTWIFPEKIVPRSILKCSVNLEKPLEKRKIHFQVETMEKGKIRSANINQDNPN